MYRWHYWKWCCGIIAVALCGAVWLVWPEQREPDLPATDEQTAAPLPEADRKFLWDAESIGLELGRSALKQVLLIGRLRHPFATRTKQHSLERSELFLETFMLSDKRFVRSGSFFRHVLRLNQTPLALRQIIGNVVFTIHHS